MSSALAAHLPNDILPKKKPWISDRTLDLLEKRNSARALGDVASERSLQRRVRKPVKQDRSRWLQQLAGTGDWNNLRRLRKVPTYSQSRLLDAAGRVVDTDERAETFAEFLETSQWHIRPITLVPGSDAPLRPDLPVNCSPFTYGELRTGIRKLKSGKATRNGDIPAECLKALACSPGNHLEPLLELLNASLHTENLPLEWQIAKVAMRFKKGDPASCDNYRPICVLSITYKLLCLLLRDRLWQAGVDTFLWKPEFGFRPKRSTSDAIFVARRRLESSHAQRYGRVSMVALDWRKAFDSVHIDALLDSLRRFGIPSIY